MAEGLGKGYEVESFVQPWQEKKVDLVVEESALEICRRRRHFIAP